MPENNEGACAKAARELAREIYKGDCVDNEDMVPAGIDAGEIETIQKTTKAEPRIKIVAGNFPKKTISWAKIKKIAVTGGSARVGCKVRMSPEAVAKAEEFVKEYIIAMGEEGAERAIKRNRKTIQPEDLEKSFINL